MDPAHLLAESAVTRDFRDLPPAIAQATSDVLADALACALAGTRAAGMDAVRSAAAGWGAGDCTVWGGFGRAPAGAAAFINAGSLNALDFDDTDDAVPLHVCSVLLPALLADLEQCRSDCDGRELLTALAVGIDCSMRVGRAGGPRGTRGWNWGSMSAAVGAVLAVARLRRWDADMAVNALGHLLSQIGGSLQSVIESSPGMRLLPGFLAQDALQAVTLAQAGLAGPREVFSGRAGLVGLYQEGRFDRAALLPGLAQCSLVAELGLKPFPCCRFTHPGIALALQAHAQGVRKGDIRQVRLTVTKQTRNMVGRPFDAACASVLDAQFSLAYTVAAALLRGAVQLADFTLPVLREAQAGDFAAACIHIEVNPDVPAVGLVPARMEVELVRGGTLALTTFQVPGGPGQRMSRAQLHGKIADCLAFNQARFDAQTLLDEVQALSAGVPAAGLLARLA